MFFADMDEFNNKASQSEETGENIGYQSLGDTFNAGVKNMLASGNADSEDSYKHTESVIEIDRLLSQTNNDQDRKTIELYKRKFDSHDMRYLRGVIEDGKLIYNADTHQYEGNTAHYKWVASKYKMMLDPIKRYDDLIAKNGFRDLSKINQDARSKAYKDYTETQKRLSNTEGFTSWLAEMGGTMAGGLQDPVTAASLAIGSPVKIVGEGIKAITHAGAKAFAQEVKIGIGLEALTAPQVYDWKNEIGIDYSVRDALIESGASVLAGGLIRGAGSIVVDATPALVKKFKQDAKERGDAEAVELADHMEAINRDSLFDDTTDHIEALHDARRQIDEGLEARTSEAMSDSKSVNQAKKEIIERLEKEGKEFIKEGHAPTIKDQYVNNPLNDINEVPMQRTGTDDLPPSVGKEPLKIDLQDHKKLEDLRIEKEGKSDYVDAKYQEVESFTKDNSDAIVAHRELQEDGEIISKQSTLKEELDIIDNDIKTINKMLDCAL